MFRFAYPEYLWLLWLLPLLVAVWTAAGQLARRRLSRFGRLETIRPLMPDASTGRRRLKFILYLTAFALLTLALARPQLGSKLREVGRWLPHHPRQSWRVLRKADRKSVV